VSDYQEQLIQARRAALWRECDRVRAERARQGKRPDQAAYSASVLLVVGALVVLAGVGCGVLVAIGRGLP